MLCISEYAQKSFGFLALLRKTLFGKEKSELRAEKCFAFLARFVDFVNFNVTDFSSPLTFHPYCWIFQRNPTTMAANRVQRKIPHLRMEFSSVSRVFFTKTRVCLPLLLLGF